VNARLDSSSTLPALDDARWRAVQARDRAHDGAFWFAVRTTGVYCRPSCASRAPRRENVAFFDSTSAARAAGFRACLRCRPDGLAPHPHVAAVARACRLLDAEETPRSIAELADAAGLSPYHFARVFKSVTGLTPMGYQRALRRGRLTEALRDAPSVTAAIYDAGFNSPSRVYEGGTAALGMTPSAWRAAGEGERIRHAVVPCALGHVLVAATGRGVCVIELGDDAAALEARHRTRFARAELTPADAEFCRWVEAVVRIIDSPGGPLELPLDIRGTAFQQRVWEALRAIPCGATASYAEVARRIGFPKAARGVAQACAANLVAVAVPCHRVVRADGALGGYRWGLPRKEALLARERDD
jgi:AraC family transcriptional regulator of adaptative response/methylated-DNA-[protein]-cysteine methyltransferase